MKHCTHCLQQAIARGMCKHHYAQHRHRMNTRGQWDGRVDSTGTARRLQALVALGYTQTYLWDRLTGDAARQNCHHLLTQDRPTVTAKTARKVAQLYDELSMTPGPSDRSRRKAAYYGWAPPLAWDEDEIDNPEAHPDTGIHAKPKFPERYAELRELGYSDFDIARKWQLRPQSLLRQIHRYNLTPTPEFVTFATEVKRREMAS